jgi:lipoprotein NlpI
VRRILLLWLAAWCGTAPPCLAAGYDDFASGISANLAGDSDRAIAAFTAAIAAGDLTKALLPAAYRGRGEAYLGKQQCDLALADLDASLKLKPDDPSAAGLHAETAFCLGKFDMALAEMSAFDATTHPWIHWERGRLYFSMGNYQAAVEDLLSYVSLRPKDSYGILWLELSRLRAGTLDPKVAARDISGVDSSAWPAPLLALYAGKVRVEDIPASVARGRADGRDGRQCEADYYVAEWRLASADTTAGRLLLQDAADHCPLNFIESRQARYEIKHLP